METSTPAPKKKALKILAGVAVGVVAFVAAQQLFFKTSSSDRKLMATASETNKYLHKYFPVMVDEETRLDSVTALPGNVFEYHYTLVNTLKDSIDVPQVEQTLKPVLLNHVKTSPTLEFLREGGVTMVYHYKDKTGTHLFTHAFPSSQYK